MSGMHATYFETVGAIPTTFAWDNYVLGVSCERLSRPAREHVAHHRKHPDSKMAHAIVNPSDLSRDLSLDMCQSVTAECQTD